MPFGSVSSLPLTTLTIEVVGVGCIVEIDGPGAPRGRVHLKSDTQATDYIEENIARVRRVSDPLPAALPEPPPPTNFAPAITRRSKKWQEQKQETPS